MVSAHKNIVKFFLISILSSIIIGFFTGVLCSLFGNVLLWIVNLHSAHVKYLLPFMFVAGSTVVIIRSKFLYRNVLGEAFKICHTNREVKNISPWYLPFIICGTWLCHLVGASVGREGVAMQIGSTTADIVSVPFSKHLSDDLKIKLRKVLIASGIAAGFSGLFHVPIAASFFAFELFSAQCTFLYAILPTFISSFTAYITSSSLWLHKFEAHIANTSSFSGILMLKFIVFGLACSCVGFIFSFALKFLRKVFDHFLPNLLIRVLIGSFFLSITLWIAFSGRYNGLGTNLILNIFTSSQPHIYWFDWLLKIIFTALCLTVGFFGGEVTPIFTIGACFGFWFAPIVGITPLVGAALGYVSVFASCTNTLFAPIFIALEIFGFNIFCYAIPVVFIAFITNFDYSIYSSFLDSKGIKNRIWRYLRHL